VRAALLPRTGDQVHKLAPDLHTILQNRADDGMDDAKLGATLMRGDMSTGRPVWNAPKPLR
jgi:hypothetical protein